MNQKILNETDKEDILLAEKKQKQSTEGVTKKANLKKSTNAKPALTKQQEEKKLIYEQLQVILEEKKRIKQKEIEDKLF